MRPEREETQNPTNEFKPTGEINPATRKLSDATERDIAGGGRMEEEKERREGDEVPGGTLKAKRARRG